MAEAPKYWGTWKGSIIRAIAEAGFPLTWTEIRDATELNDDSVYTAIGELLDVKDLWYEEEEGVFHVETELYWMYRDVILGRLQERGQPTPRPSRADELKYPTKKGHNVRSKGEVVIADTLWTMGIPYEYEKPLRNPRIYWDFKKPDFTIMWSGRVWYWEHLGMHSDAEYQEKWRKKKAWYEKHDLGVQLITSMDPSGGYISHLDAEQIIRERILSA